MHSAARSRARHRCSFAESVDASTPPSTPRKLHLAAARCELLHTPPETRRFSAFYLYPIRSAVSADSPDKASLARPVLARPRPESGRDLRSNTVASTPRRLRPRVFECAETRSQRSSSLLTWTTDRGLSLARGSRRRASGGVEATVFERRPHRSPACGGSCRHPGKRLPTRPSESDGQRRFYRGAT